MSVIDVLMATCSWPPIQASQYFRALGATQVIVNIHSHIATIMCRHQCI